MGDIKVVAIALVDEDFAISDENDQFPIEIRRHFNNIKKIKRSYFVFGNKSINFYKPYQHIDKNFFNVIITTDKQLKYRYNSIYFNFEHMLNSLAMIERDIYFLGGESVYQQGLPYCDEIILTQVKTKIPNPKKYFPKINEDEWELISEKEYSQDFFNHKDFAFKIYKRKD